MINVYACHHTLLRVQFRGGFPEWVPCAVKPLVMECSPVAQLFEILDFREYVVGVCGVMLHFCEFLVSQATGLFEYFIAHRDFTDVMQRSGEVHFLRGFLVKSHEAGQLFSAGGNSDRMRAGERRFVVHYFCEEISQRLDLRET